MAGGEVERFRRRLQLLSQVRLPGLSRAQLGCCLLPAACRLSTVPATQPGRLPHAPNCLNVRPGRRRCPTPLPLPARAG